MIAQGSGDAEVFTSWPEVHDPAGGLVRSRPKLLRWLCGRSAGALGSSRLLLEVSFFFLETESMALDLGYAQNLITRFSYTKK